jgi:hypothetical protein
MDDCVRCHEVEAGEPGGYCATCAALSKTEVSEGYRRIQRYLAAWAAFDEWLRERGAGLASA